MEEKEKITPIKLPRGMAISLGKAKAKFLRSCCGVNLDLLGPCQPERSKREDCEKGFHFQTDPTKQYENGWDCDCGAQIRRCGTLNTMET